MQIFKKKNTAYTQRKCSTGSDTGHWQFSCYICDKSQTQMCPIFLTESMDMRQINSNYTEWGNTR